MDSLAVAELSNIAQSGGFTNSTRNLLDYAYEGEWEPDHSLPTAREERTAVGSTTRHHQSSIRAFPNPATTVTFEFTILLEKRLRFAW
ncbi:MAG: hypothetical protein H6559_27480 [Lewinellaceae bacterium]|nr:hypothetical protein [Lewinellaceae bacterium]